MKRSRRSARLSTTTGTALHIGISVSDLKRSLHFYGDVLGLVVLSRREVSGDRLSAGVQVPNARIKIALIRATNIEFELLQYLHPPGKPFDRQNNEVGSFHVAFEVKDLLATYARLQEQGVPCNNAPYPVSNREGWGWFYARDPDGITLEFNGPLKSDKDGS